MSGKNFSTPSPSYSLTLRLQIANKPGMLGKVTSTIGKAGGDLGAIDIASASPSMVVRDITVNARGEDHGQEILRKVKAIPGVKIVNFSDRTFLLHLGGKIEVRSKFPVKTRDNLSMIYTPGVGRVSTAIAEEKSRVWQLTIKKNSVAIVTDGSAVLGLGDLGPYAALPVMEGKAMLFKEFANIDAFPICLSTKEPREIIDTVVNISPAFGGINLEDISSPRCFEIEEQLKHRLDIPVFHDDQHGTAVTLLAALFNALKIVRKDFNNGQAFKKIKVVFLGVGAAGVACTKILLEVGTKNIIGCDQGGIVSRKRKDLDGVKRWYAEHTNPDQIEGNLVDALNGADVFIGLSSGGAVSLKELKKMKKNAIVFALANPVPEILPEEASRYARVIATGRSDYPNQINNALAFPGIFRGALDCRAQLINEQMKIAAARAIANIVSASELQEDYIIPSIFNPRVVKEVSEKVMKVAIKTKVARRLGAGG